MFKLLEWPRRVSFAAVVLSVLWTSAARGTTFNCAGGNTACLADAIRQANSNPQNPLERLPTIHTINLGAGTYHLSTVDTVATEGPVGLPPVTSRIEVHGRGAGKTIIQRDDGAPDFRILQVQTGGALTLTGLTVRGGRFVVNFAAPTAGGSGLMNLGTLILTNVEVLDHFNQGDRCAGIQSWGKLTILGSRIERNTTDGAGGGICNYGPAEIRRTTFRNNRSDIAGGAIYSEGTLQIVDSSFTQNSSGFNGGAIDSRDLAMTGTTIAKNWGDYGPGGVQIERGTVRINNSTIASNVEVGLAVLGGTVSLQNSILATNVSLMDQPHPPRDCWGTITSLGNNLIGDLSNCTVTLLPTDRTGDPHLDALQEALRGADGLSTGNSYMPLLPGSPAIDAGDPGSCSPTDQLMRPRTDGDLNGSVICDIGAVEFVPYVTSVFGPAREKRLSQKTVATYAPAGTMIIRRRYTNTGKRPIAHPVFVVRKLTQGFFLLSAEKPPGGVGSRQPMKSGSENMMAPGESTTVEFKIGLANRKPFDFEVDIQGYPQ